LEGLRVGSEIEDGVIVTKIESNNLKTLINTLDDFISCQMAAEKLLDG